jgi:uncharacterized repeat protein (TIGR03803 family)
MLYAFSGSDGAYAQAGLVQSSDGNFYGATNYGGASNNGTIFRVTPSGSLTTVHSFSGSDGATPTGALVQDGNGNFYGITSDGGASGVGTVFQMAPSGVLITLHSFSFSDGANPVGGLLQATDGNFYGTTVGGVPGGTVFTIAPLPPPPTNKDQCKNGGWKIYLIFKNQGDCIQFVNTGK